MDTDNLEDLNRQRQLILDEIERLQKELNDPSKREQLSLSDYEHWRKKTKRRIRELESVVRRIKEQTRQSREGILSKLLQAQQQIAALTVERDELARQLREAQAELEEHRSQRR